MKHICYLAASTLTCENRLPLKCGCGYFLFPLNPNVKVRVSRPQVARAWLKQKALRKKKTPAHGLSKKDYALFPCNGSRKKRYPHFLAHGSCKKCCATCQAHGSSKERNR